MTVSLCFLKKFLSKLLYFVCHSNLVLLVHAVHDDDQTTLPAEPFFVDVTFPLMIRDNLHGIMPLQLTDFLVCLMFVSVGAVCRLFRVLFSFLKASKRPVIFSAIEPSKIPCTIEIEPPILSTTLLSGQVEASRLTGSSFFLAPIAVTFHLGSNHQQSGKHTRRKAFHRSVTRRPVISYRNFPPEIWAKIMGYLDWKSLGRFDSAIGIPKCLDSFRFFRSPALDQLPLHLLPLKWVKARSIRLCKLQSVLLPIDEDFFEDDDFFPSIPPSTLTALRFIDLSKLTTIDIYTDRNAPGLLSSIAKSKPALRSCKFEHSMELDEDFTSHDLGNPHTNFS